MAPSSPKRPCSALKAASGFNSASLCGASRPTSRRVTLKPSASSARAQASPERSETSRSAERPPISTATCLVKGGAFRGGICRSSREGSAPWQSSLRTAAPDTVAGRTRKTFRRLDQWITLRRAESVESRNMIDSNRFLLFHDPRFRSSSNAEGNLEEPVALSQGHSFVRTWCAWQNLRDSCHCRRDKAGADCSNDDFTAIS